MRILFDKCRIRVPTIITRYKRGMTRNIILNICGIIFLCTITYSLLWPQKGITPFDQSIFQLLGMIYYFIWLEIGIGLLYLIFNNDDINSCILTVALIIFSLALYVNSIYIGDHELVVANITLGLVSYVASNWLTMYAWFYRKLFPFLLIGIFTFYGILSIGELAIRSDNGYRLQIIFNHPNHLGNLLAFALVFCFAITTSTTHRNSRLLLYLLMLLLTIALVNTLSRGAWLGGIISLTISILYLKRHISLKRICFNLVLLALMIFVGFATISPGYMAKRFSIDSPDMQFSVGNRLLLWRVTVKVIRDHWLTGVGIGNYGQYLRQYYNVSFANHGSFRSAMNNYLNLAAEAGIPILLLYLFCLFYACNIARKNITGEDQRVGINIGLLCGIYSMIIFSLTTYTLGRVYATVLVWSVFGYLASCSDHLPDFRGLAQPSFLKINYRVK